MSTKNTIRQNVRGKGKRFHGKRQRFDKKKIFTKQKRPGQLADEEIKELQARYDKTDSSQLALFKDFPISQNTMKGLEKSGYTKPTEIQRESVLLALQGNDILGAAKTGSGKTLAFLIPVLECLYRLKWSSEDGLGALIITPTRELAYQIYEVLRKIGKHHDFSAGLVIGGKHLKEESERIQKTNIVICTPGRMQQHLDETPYFTADNLQMLILDEADRILDLGFQQCINAIVENLPIERQTLLFSATQTRSVKDLARLSLKDPMYVSVHEMAKHSTPTQLSQSYIVCELHEKLDVLWSFIKNHLKAKILVFMTSCKQVRYVYETFKRLHPGMTVLCLHGAMQQLKRVAVYEAFCRKQHAVLFATDIAARGLDFPAVNWVLQLDCPEDANTYIHRAGRTARYEKDGEALLVLLPSEEEAMVAELHEKKIPINKIQVNVKKMSSIKKKLESLCASDVTLKQFAQRAFVSYMKATFLMKNKQVFDVGKLDTAAYAESLGLAIPPRVRFIQRKSKKFSNKDNLTDEMNDVFSNPKDTLSQSLKKANAAENNSSESEAESESESMDESDNESKLAAKKKASSERLDFDLGGEELDDILVVKKRNVTLPYDNESSSEDETLADQEKSKDKKGALTKAKLAKKLQKKNIKVNTKVTYDDEGDEVADKIHKAQAVVSSDSETEMGGINLELARKRLQQEDKIDKELYRERVKRKHREKRLKDKDARRKQKKQEDENDSDLDEPDLSHIPDPDKIYGKQDSEDETPPNKRQRAESESAEESENAEDESESGEDESESGEDESESGEDGSESGEESETDTEKSAEPSLQDYEALALRLLG